MSIFFWVGTVGFAGNRQLLSRLHQTDEMFPCFRRSIVKHFGDKTGNGPGKTPVPSALPPALPGSFSAAFSRRLYFSRSVHSDRLSLSYLPYIAPFFPRTASREGISVRPPCSIHIILWFCQTKNRVKGSGKINLLGHFH